MITETTLRQRIATRIEPQTYGLDTPIELTPVPKFDPYKRQAAGWHAKRHLAPVTFPARRQGPAVLRAIAASRFLTGCSLAAGGVWLVVIGVCLLLVGAK